MSVLSLPSDVLLLVFSYLDLSDSASLARVSRSCAATLASSSQIWQVWWTQHAWLRKEHELPKEIWDGGKKEGENWRACCKLRCQYEYDQLDENSDLCYVAYQGSAKAIIKLISLGVNVNFARGTSTPLHCAAERGHTHVISVLVRLGADVNARRDVTPLHVAARFGRCDAIAQLVALGANVNATSANSSTPLHFAVHAGVETVRTLVKLGADVNARNKHGDTPLHEAAESNCEAVAKALVEFGADVNARNNAGSSPLHSAAECKGSIAQTLMRMGAQVDTKDNGGATPYHLAVWRGNAGTAQELAHKGAKEDKPPAGALFMRVMQSNPSD